MVGIVDIVEALAEDQISMLLLRVSMEENG